MKNKEKINVVQSNEVTPLAGAAPDTPWDWNAVGGEVYEYSGTANPTNWLYTNYLFTGYSAYDIKVHNGYSENVTWQWRDKKTNDVTIESGTVAPGDSLYTRIDTGLSSSADYYLRFEGPCEVDGYVTPA